MRALAVLAAACRRAGRAVPAHDHAQRQREDRHSAQKQRYTSDSDTHRRPSVTLTYAQTPPSPRTIPTVRAFVVLAAACRRAGRAVPAHDHAQRPREDRHSAQKQRATRPILIRTVTLTYAQTPPSPRTIPTVRAFVVLAAACRRAGRAVPAHDHAQRPREDRHSAQKQRATRPILIRTVTLTYAQTPPRRALYRLCAPSLCSPRPAGVRGVPSRPTTPRPRATPERGQAQRSEIARYTSDSDTHRNPHLLYAQTPPSPRTIPTVRAFVVLAAACRRAGRAVPAHDHAQRPREDRHSE